MPRDVLKRLLDVTGAALGLFLLAPLLVGLGLLVRLTSPGPALYPARRVGRQGRSFVLYKFRTMRAAGSGPAITAQGDVRVTPVGRFLRRTKLDELPQLVNVLRGEMSLVGPRPEDPRYVALYDREQLGVLDLRPGITGPASVAYRDEERLLRGSDWERTYREEVMPAKLDLDLAYRSDPSLVRDLEILARTFRALLPSSSGRAGRSR